MKIGEVAAAAGVNTQTLRYYERRGLVTKPKRAQNGYRRYDADTVRRVRFIKRAQNLGFSLTEINELLGLRKRRGATPKVRGVAREKLDQVEQKIKELTAVKKALTTLITECERRGTMTCCPILEALAGPDA